MRISTALIALSLIVITPVASQAWTIDTSQYRIGTDHDGNQHDEDDFGASAMGIALIAEAGIKSKLVHVDHSNHLGNNNSTMNLRRPTCGSREANRGGHQPMF